MKQPGHEQAMWDFQRRPMRRIFARPRPGSVTAWLIFINVFVYVADSMLTRWGYTYRFATPDNAMIIFSPLNYWGHFSKLLAVDQFQVWRFVTFQFLHANFDHLVFNMLTLFFFGPMIEAYLSSRLYLPFYLLCGIGGAMFYLALLVSGHFVQLNWSPLIGASAGIFGLLVASARIAPNSIALIFGFFPIRLRTATWLFIAYGVFQVIFRRSNWGGEAAHLGGAIVGFLLITWPQVLERIAWLGKRAPPF
jgi:membrane associated rhomboid family serine protease